MDHKVALVNEAARLRRLAEDILDPQAELALLALAAEYEARAAEMPGDSPDVIDAVGVAESEFGR